MVSQFFKTSPPLQCQKLALRSQTQRTALRRPLLILGVAADSAPPQAGERPGKQLTILQPPSPPGKPVPVGLVHLGYPLKQVCGLRYSVLPGLTGKLPPLSCLPVLLLFGPAQPLHGILLHLQGIGPLGPHMFAPQLLAQPGKLPSMDPLLLRRAHKQQLHHRQPIPVGRSRRQHIPAAGQIFLRQPPGQIFQSTAGHIHTKRLLFCSFVPFSIASQNKITCPFRNSPGF